MTTSEKVAYLKGLAEGLGLAKDSKEDKLFAAIIDVLDTVARDLEELEDNALDLGDEIDAISDDLAAVEDILYDEDDCCCGDYDDDDCCCGDHDDCCDGHHHHDHDCCCGHDHGDPVLYEVTCPACNNTITVDEDVLDLGAIQCPNCGETLEFDLDCIECDESAPAEEPHNHGCGCGCEG